VLSGEGETVVVDPVSLPFLAQARIDFSEELIGARFVIDNPNATAPAAAGPPSRSEPSARRPARVAAMRIATYNINGIRARLETVTAWLSEKAPDVALLQEIKIVDEAFRARRSSGWATASRPTARRASTAWQSCPGCRWRTWARGLPGDDADGRPGGSRPRDGREFGRSESAACTFRTATGAGDKYNYKLAGWFDCRARAARSCCRRNPPSLRATST
jgi:hypothetical protein